MNTARGIIARTTRWLRFRSPRVFLPDDTTRLTMLVPAPFRPQRLELEAERLRDVTVERWDLGNLPAVHGPLPGPLFASGHPPIEIDNELVSPGVVIVLELRNNSSAPMWLTAAMLGYQLAWR